MEQMKIVRNRSVVVLVLVLLLNILSAGSSFGESDGVLRATLKNGLRVVIVQNKLAPVVTTRLNYLVGANEDPEGLQGMAHAQEHMMFRGSPGLSADQLSSLIAATGGEFNANTQQTVTQYFLTVPKDVLDVALHIEAIRMKGILDSEKLWQRERGAIEQEVAQDFSNPEYVFYTKMLSSMFAGTPYSHDALGTKASFDRMTGKMMRKFHSAWYCPNNAILVIAGDVDTKKTLVKVRSLFESIRTGKTPSRPVVQLKPLKAAEIKVESDLPYKLVVVAYRLPGYDSPDYAAGEILADVLGSKRGNLYALVPDGKALSADFNFSALPKSAIGYVTAALPVGGDSAAMLSDIKNIIGDYLKKGFPSDLVEAAKRLEIADDEFQKNSVDGLAALWSQALAVEGRNSPDEDIKAIAKVTVDDVNRVAHEYLINDTVVTGVLEPGPSGEAVSVPRVREKESFAPKQTKHVSLPEWAKKATSLPAVPASTVKPVVTDLPNGLRLIVQPESVSRTVSVYGRVKNNADLQVPVGKEGLGRISDELFKYGTDTLDRLAFQKALDDIAAQESAGTSFSLQVMAEHLDRGVELLADNLLRPAFPEKAFEVVKQETIGELRGLLKSPSYLSKRALLTGLYPKNDPVLRQATPETVTRLSVGDVKDYYLKVFRPDMTTVVVIGNVTPDRAKAVIEKFFGKWKAEGPKPKTDLPPVPSNKPSSSAIADRSRVQDEATLSETIGIMRSNPDYYALQVGRHVLSGAFYATRLYRDLREKTGLVYAVEAWLDAGKTRSTFSVFYACDPQNVAKARNIVERNLLDMQKKPVSHIELRQAKTLLIRQIPLSESSMDGIAERLLYYSLEDLPLDEPIRAAKHYREITASQVKRAFVKWIRPEDFVQVTLGPSPE
jgi:zinc protease